MCVRERERACVCVCVCERERESVCVREREKERACVCERERERACVCVCVLFPHLDLTPDECRKKHLMFMQRVLIPAITFHAGSSLLTGLDS